MTGPASAPTIRVRDLRKTYQVHERDAGVIASVRSLVRRRGKDVVAVDGISFEVAPGGIVGFLGPNGAGKTTALKMLSGLLYPSAGEVTVLGHVPSRRERAFLHRMTLVMGQRNQLAWDIPVADSLELNRAIYRIEPTSYRRTLDELVDLLDLAPLLTKPVRNLSLGERMKCEVAAALLHSPQVLFLDEPTLGLDVTMQRRIRSFIKVYNERHGATTLLTSHYMADVEALCRRVVVIHHGKLLFDGDLDALIQRFSPHKTIAVDLDVDDLDGQRPALAAYGDLISLEDGRATLRVPKSDTAAVTSRLLADLPVIDLIVADPPIEEVIDRVFSDVDPNGTAPDPAALPAPEPITA